MGGGYTRSTSRVLRSVLRPIFFNIFLSNLLLIIDETEFASYADDNTLYDAGNTIEDVILSLQESSKNLFKWFSDNAMQDIRENVIRS